MTLKDLDMSGHVWLTVADGDAYEAMASDLVVSASYYDISFDVYGRGDLPAPFHDHPQILKPMAIRNAARMRAARNGRVTFVDADCLIVGDPRGIAAYEGCVPEEWDRGDRFMVSDPDGLFSPDAPRRFRQIIETEFPDMAKTVYSRRDFNGGVISGPSDMMLDLCDRWEHWLRVLLDVCDGCFRSDQAAMRLAYWEVVRRPKRGDLPKVYNWLVKRWGYENVQGGDPPVILHRAGLNSGAPQHKAALREWRRKVREVTRCDTDDR